MYECRVVDDSNFLVTTGVSVLWRQLSLLEVTRINPAATKP